DRRDPGKHGRGIRAALLVQLAEAALDRREPALDGARKRVLEQDGAPRSGHDLRDACAHLARADDEDALEDHGPSLPRAASSARRCRSRRTEHKTTSATITATTTTA